MEHKVFRALAVQNGIHNSENYNIEKYKFKSPYSRLIKRIRDEQLEKEKGGGWNISAAG